VGRGGPAQPDDQGAGHRSRRPGDPQLIGEGININVTLLFGVDAYLAVAEAHMAGLEAARPRAATSPSVHGVASFFVSRIDTQIDKEIDARLKAGDPPGTDAEALKRCAARSPSPTPRSPISAIWS
jgi:hypothetical protein